MGLRNREFVQACLLMGMSNRRIIFLHILPNALSAIIVTVSAAGIAKEPTRAPVSESTPHRLSRAADRSQRR